MITPFKISKLVGFLGVAGLFFVAGSASAAVTGSLHDLSQGQTGTEVCIYCHTPHNANSQGTPLWNRNNGTETNFDLYTSDTLDETASQPVGVSQACLSCHDGTIAFNSITNTTSSAATQADNAALMGDTGYDTVTGSEITTLANQHPVSITLPVDATEFNTDTAAETAGAVIYGDQVECGSCHDPHGGVASTPFLRVDNANSDLCKACHLK